ncbi:hypothetical protein [Marinicrinis sediminis]|uniref:DUF2232 domain-containing protein n=1 Tax=Marinicrinis sediminis TaxID=1652465 RepID=A0ABW5RGC5_9BACL
MTAPRYDRLGIGILVLSLCHLIWFLWPMVFILIGMAQIIYLAPLVVFAVVKKTYRFLQGLLIGALITFLVNSACFGLVFVSFW